MAKPWFGVKKYGYGLSPASAEGWVAIVVFVVLIGSTAPVVALLGWPLWTAAVAGAVETALFFALMFAKSDGLPWRWRWGGAGKD